MKIDEMFNKIEERNAKIAEKIIKTGRAVDIFKFAVNVRPAPINELADAIIKTENVNFIRRFATEVSGPKPLDKLIKGVATYGEPVDVLSLLRDLGGIPFDRSMALNNFLVNYFSKYGNAWQICAFVRLMYAGECSKEHVNALTNALINTGDFKFYCAFAQEFEKVLGNVRGDEVKEIVQKLSDKIIESNSPDIISEFAQKVKGASIKKLMQVCDKLKAEEENKHSV